MELFTTLKRFILEEHLWHSKVCTKKEAIDIETKKASRAVGFRLKREWDNPDYGL